MGLALPASVVCDKCGERAAGGVALTKLRPHPEMYLRLPEGWAVSSRPESEELLVTSCCGPWAWSARLVTSWPSLATRSARQGEGHPSGSEGDHRALAGWDL